MPSAGTTLTDLISRHAIALVFTTFLVLLLAVVVLLVIARIVWRRGKVRFLSHLSTTGFLQAYLVAGLLVSLGVLFFASLAEEIGEKSSLLAFDTHLASALQNAWTARTVMVFGRLTVLGGGATLATIAIGVGVILLLRKERRLLIAWIAATLGAGVLTWGLKAIFQRVRPEYAHISGWSFPSGHSLGSFVTYGMLAYVLSRFLPRWPSRIIGAALLLLVLFIGFSRLYLGVHYFSDVLAGYSAAMIWLAVCISGSEIVRMREHARQPV